MYDRLLANSEVLVYAFFNEQFPFLVIVVVQVPSQLTALAAYTDAMLAHSAFTQTMYPEETVIWGWTNARADTPSETE